MCADRFDPNPAFRFVVEIGGIEAAAFQEVSGLASEVGVVEYRAGTDMTTIRKLPGLVRFPNIVLRRGLTVATELFDWHSLLTGGRTPSAEIRRDGSILLVDEAGDSRARFNFRNGLPVRWEGPFLNAQTNEIALETLEIAHEGLEMVS